ncbi:bifunctional UDP-sugar hydrolase/5'-nucleotidase [uncultured Rossellomorea sp.]|uniref:bifunctional metallophosphatase/5'-nucleotidase n=1 Tax=uncultured Rossellomorea sp. TaxID=2837549 RepID=UPI0026242A13|nr:bifunctional UDP-sugar hydrolase/5'-nucleotidase [uncultured Rossellomorea sp.]
MNKTITILHTNDLHGNYELVVRQAAYIKERVSELKARGESYLLLDGGDHLDMSINECLATNGHMHLDMLSDVGYHAMSAGNNELLRSTPELIRKHSRKSSVPWLLLNLVEGDGTPIGGMKETLLVTVDNGVKVGLFGATDQFGDLYENKHGFKNLETLGGIKKAVADLKEQGADVIVFLSHLGYGADVEMAKEVSCLVDVIVGAHSHTVLQRPVVESGVVIVQAGSHGQYVGELKLDLHIENGLDKIKSFEGKLVEITPESEADASMEAILEKGREETNEFFSEVLYTTSEELTHADVIQLIADAVRDYWKSEIGIMYGGAAVDEGLETGDVTKGDVYNRCRSMHSPVLMELKGEQIAGLIEDCLNQEVISKPVYGNGFRPHGIAIGALAFSGVTWRDNDGVISDVKVNGEGLVGEKVYKVGTGSPLLYKEVCGYASVKGNKLVEVGKTEMVKDVFMDYLRANRESPVKLTR